MFSRRIADRIIEQKRVQINATPADLGAWISYGDILTVDGKMIDWEQTMKSKMEVTMVSTDNMLRFF
jgi:RNA-binding protein YlmH